jgi:putative lipoprotein
MGRRVLAWAILALLVGTPAIAAKVTLSGEVTYRERIALPESATLRLQLVDETIPAAPPRLDVEAPIGHGQVPLAFSLSFEDSLILPNHSYALIATILGESGLLFRNFEPYPINPLTPVEPVVIVTNFVGQTASSASSEQPAEPTTPPILESTWTATAIAGADVAPRSTSSLQIGSDMRAGGVGGCNSYFSQVQLDGDLIRFSGITSTMKSCGQSLNLQEAAFFDALKAAASWQIAGDELTLLDTAGQPLVILAR